MKKISVFTLLLTLIAGGVFAQTPRTLENKNNNWNNPDHWQNSATNATALSIPKSVDTVYIGRHNKEMAIRKNTAAVASKVIVKNKNLKIEKNASLNCDSLIFESNNNKNEIQGSVTGTVVCRNGGKVKLNGDKDVVVVTGTIIVESGSTLDIGNDKSKVSGNIIVKSGGTINNFKNLKTANFTNGTLIVEDGAILNGRNDAFDPSNSNSNATYAIELKNGWNFVGLPLNENIAPLAADDAPAIWALRFDYDSNAWRENYLHYVENGQKDTLAKGNGMFVYLAEPSYYLRLGNGTVSTIEDISYPYEQPRTAAQGRWFALANPLTSSLNIASFRTANGSRIQGNCIYRYVAGNPGESGTFETLSEGTIKIGQGFFVNMADGQSDITFNYPSSKSKSAEREFVRVSVATNGYKVPVMFAQNDDASDGYDIYDANKMFGDGSVAEPYLVCNGINLCKEEVNSVSYTATMNIKSFESRSVEIVADNIPEGYSLTLIDGAVEVAMSEGDVYTTDIAEGENAERFKLLINKNNVSIADVAEVESVRVVNNNRSIRVYGGKSVRTEVYNALGQKVYETSDRVFDLNNVASGAYVLRVQDGKSVNSTKIVVE